MKEIAKAMELLEVEITEKQARRDAIKAQLPHFLAQDYLAGESSNEVNANSQQGALSPQGES